MEEHTITIKISDGTWNRTICRAMKYGMLPEELISAFLEDLTYGDYSNGSDERMHANEWFDRCRGTMVGSLEDSLLKKLLESRELEDFLNVYDDLKSAKESIEWIKRDIETGVVKRPWFDNPEGYTWEKGFYVNGVHYDYSSKEEWEKKKRAELQEQEEELKDIIEEYGWKEYMEKYKEYDNENLEAEIQKASEWFEKYKDALDCF